MGRILKERMKRRKGKKRQKEIDGSYQHWEGFKLVRKKRERKVKKIGRASVGKECQY